jgi:diguanylate cyclase (GGDEF)-like protein
MFSVSHDMSFMKESAVALKDLDANPSEAQARQVDDLNQQAMEVYYQHPDQAVLLLEQAGALAQAGAFAAQPYRAGLAASLAALARLNMETRPDQAARHCLQILSLLDGSPVIAPLVEAQNGLGWIYFHLGDYSTSMEWAMKALHHSQELGLTNHEAASMDLIANIHGMLNEFPQALRAHETAIQIVRSRNRISQEANLLNNLAMTQMAMGEYALAMQTSLDCLARFQELGSVLDIANCHDTLAQIYLGMGEFAQAETNLLAGLQIITSYENQVIETYLLKNLGRVYLAQANLPAAIDNIERACTIAQHNQLRVELAECHQLLATIYEQQAQYPAALQHFKQFYDISKELNGDTATRRLAILNVIHAVENAKHEAEIYRLRNIELQSEIEERKRVQDALHELATRDPLTALFNRRYFLEKSEYEYAMAIRHHFPLAVIMIDLDLFKNINDTYGHPVGDQVLTMVAERLRGFTRSEDIAGRMGGEEFALVLSKTNLNGACLAAERLCKSFSDDALLLNAHSIRVTVSVGVTCYLPSEAGTPPSFDILLQQADQALYSAKNAGRNQVQVFSPS